jgi:thiol:disulfide interchange protein DsbD
MFVAKIKNLVLLGLMMLAAFSVYSQAQAPVSLSMSVNPAKVKSGGKLTAQISASIGGGWHVYSITQGAGGPVPTRITVETGVFKQAGAASGSAAKRELDANFGIETETYTGSASFSVPVSVDAAAQPGTQDLTVNVRYQACNNKVCLPPKTLKVSAPVEIVAATTAGIIAPSASPSPSLSVAANSNLALAANISKNANANANLTANANTETNTNVETAVGETNSTAQSLSGATTENNNPTSGTTSDSAATAATNLNGGVDANQPLWSFIWLAMSVGALSLLTPCVFPMIPITVSFFTNHAAGNRKGAIRDAVIFALGIILTFTLLGILLAVLFGAAGINKFASSPYINLIITAIFVSFALSLFGAFNIGLSR